MNKHIFLRWRNCGPGARADRAAGQFRRTQKPDAPNCPLAQRMTSWKQNYQAHMERQRDEQAVC